MTFGPETAYNARLRPIFGQGADIYLALASALEREADSRHFRYTFSPAAQLESLMRSAPERANSIYWSEMIGRAHLAALSSVLRSGQWLKGVALAESHDLYLPFCANMRALLEAAADSLAGLSGAAQTLAEARPQINDALAAKPGSLLISTKLEDQLIHYSHGRRLGKGEAAPKSHAADSARGYIGRLAALGLPDAHLIYSKLCQVTHPAADSVCHFMSASGEGEFYLSPHNDHDAILELVRSNESFFRSILMYTFNPAVVLLRVLHHLDAPEYHSGEIAALDMRAMSGWQKCARTMRVPV